MFHISLHFVYSKAGCGKDLADYSVYLLLADSHEKCLRFTPAGNTLALRKIRIRHRMKKTLGETQTLRAGCSKAELKIFAPPQTPFPGARDGRHLISWRWSLPLPTNPVSWGSMHAISSYRGNCNTTRPSIRACARACTCVCDDYHSTR